MRRSLYKLLLALLVLALAAACGGSSDPQTVAAELRGQAAADVPPPQRADPARQAQPGLILSTASPSLREVSGAPEGSGAIVLFVLPDGPSDEQGVSAGDLLVAVDGTRVFNHEHAVSLLRSRPDERREMTFLDEDGDERNVQIRAQVPATTARDALDDLVEESPRDPLLRYVRATQGTDLETRIGDIRVALEESPEFVEAITLRASLTWDQRPDARDDDQLRQLITVAMRGWQDALDIDPRHTTTLAVRSEANVDLGQPNRALGDAERAINIDGTHPKANWVLARAHIALGDIEAAVGPARAAVELNPFNDLTYYRTLATIFRELDRGADCTATAEAIAPFLEAHTGGDVEAFQEAAEGLRRICA